MNALRALGVAAVAVIVVAAACTTESSSGSSSSTSSTSGVGAGGSSTSSSGTAAGGTGGGGASTPISCTAGAVSNVEADGSCDLLNQTGCAPDQWCDMNGNPAVPACVPTAGMGIFEAGHECASPSECKAGLNCIDGHCSPYCCPDNDEPCGAGLCDIEVSFGGNNWAMMCSYALACTLLEDTCPQGFDCHIADATQGLAVCDEPAPSAVGEGEACQYRNDCGESQLCNSNGGDNGICRQLCNINTWQTDQVPTGGCPPNRECMPVNTGYPDWSHIGICMPPSGTGGAGGA